MSNPTDQPEFESLPAALSDELISLYSRGSQVPMSIDSTILSLAHRRMLRQRQRRLVLRWGAAAAGLAATFLLVWRMGFVSQFAPRTVAFSPQGIDRRGNVSILDAFYLARQIRDHAVIDKSWDINGDGVIDQKDVAALANRAVALPDGQAGNLPHNTEATP